LERVNPAYPKCFDDPRGAEDYGPGMGLVSRKPVLCPMRDETIVRDKNDATGFGHFATHLDDPEGPSGPRVLRCGCPDARWDAASDFPSGVMEHLRRRHDLKL
jgi:hypothetical protein